MASAVILSALFCLLVIGSWIDTAFSVTRVHRTWVRVWIDEGDREAITYTVELRAGQVLVARRHRSSNTNSLATPNLPWSTPQTSWHRGGTEFAEGIHPEVGYLVLDNLDQPHAYDIALPGLRVASLRAASFAMGNIAGQDLARYRVVTVDHWLLAVVTAIVPLAWVVRRAIVWRRSRAVRAGLCAACGYDLRGTADGRACPERGAERRATAVAVVTDAGAADHR